ncbi:hypothetical protein QWY85_20665 [Neolewinella lacunae]|uniref:DNA mismatch repair proteins mutS family domain-containing protein n=1 Tax=Neolewinella lacunae TaxID=1517758 RepID=A0A923PMD5_9BACT|nr:hypothetical protein [Neolewinella lacunae]MBC6993843.1 hypothetical protein [Neolewinella lacunae]MDN3637096.1 hypothetical protein [Neolewinella lacunae]
MTAPKPFYTALLASQTAEAAELRRRYERLALVRLFVFLIWVVGLILAFSAGGWWGLLALGLTLPPLVWGVRQHRRIGQRAAAAEVRSQLAAGELRALDHDFGHFDGGQDLLDPAHPYALDLDIFGPHSLFQFLNRTVTAPGRELLAKQLLQPSSEMERARTQVQGQSLGAMPEWCLDFRTLGHGLHDEIGHFQRLAAWLQRPAVVTGRWERTLLLLSPVLSVLGVVTGLLFVPWFVAALAFVPAALLLRKYAEIIPREHAYTAAMGKLLLGYAALLEHASTGPGGADLRAAVPALRRLSYLSSQLDVRYNPFVLLLEISGLWSLQWLRKLDAWREAHRTALPGWLEALAETDAYVSWATLRFNQPEWTEPAFTTEPILHATGLGHPLLHPARRVTNDVEMRTDGHIQLVTGSNMAGKSTWLRTVGINLVLAQAGSPVCALHLRTRPLQVWTSMRTHDDLSAATSSFYAELKRLKVIIEAVSAPDNAVFFLLDEILKGTNSRDRHTGSRALIRQLIRDKGAGIIATHDLELADLEKEPGSHVENYAMEVKTQGDELIFDYRLHRGVSQSFNATTLMARMGIAIPPDEIRHN